MSDENIRQFAGNTHKSKEDGKRVWEKLDSYLPMYALFQSDRASKDSDDEVQNPLKGAIKAAIAEAADHIAEIEQLVREKSEEIAALTHSALKDIDPGLAESLTPKYNPPLASKWAGLFSLGMETNNGISLNKRGSGVRRMILVSFFKAEAERRLKKLFQVKYHLRDRRAGNISAPRQSTYPDKLIQGPVFRSGMPSFDDDPQSWSRGRPANRWD